MCDIYLRRLRGSHQRCEPPKIMPLCGAFVRAAACGPHDSASCIITMFYAVRRRRSECDSSPPLWGGGELRGSKSRNIHTRQPNPRQKRFRKKVGRGDGALRIGDFLILKNAKHPILRRRKDDPEIVSPRRFLGYLLSAQKVTYKTIMEDCDSLESCVPRRPFPPSRPPPNNTTPFGRRWRSRN